MEIIIIIVLLASLLTAWILSVRRGLEAQEINIHNAMNQIGVQLLVEQEALLALTELLKNNIDPEVYRDMIQHLGTPQNGRDNERDFRNRVTEPNFNVPNPVDKFAVEITLEHPYWTSFYKETGAPKFDSDHPSIIDYLEAYTEKTEELPYPGTESDAVD